MKRHILLIALGTTPHLLTITLAAIYQTHRSEMPQEIHIVTTQSGAQMALKELMGSEGLVARFYRDYGLEPALLTEKMIHVIGEKLQQPREDIRTYADSICAADDIVALVRELTQEPDTQLTVSVVGGRKSMSLLLGSAMSFYGRDQDRLSHVWSDRENEKNPPAYPMPEELQSNPDKVSFGEIPFLRLRPILPEPLLRENFSYTEIVQASQARLTDTRAIEVRVEKGRWCVYCEGRKISAETRCIGFYLWLALRTKFHRTTETTYTSVPIEAFFLLRWQLVKVLELVQTERVWQNSVRRYLGVSAERLQGILKPLKEKSAEDIAGWYRAVTADLTAQERLDVAQAAKNFSLIISNARTKMNEQIALSLLQAIPDVTGRRVHGYQIASNEQKEACVYRLDVPADQITLPPALTALLQDQVCAANVAWKIV